MNRTSTGWLYVAAQAFLLITLVALPGDDAWPTPTWLRLLGMIAVIGGIALGAVAALRLGPALTPTPVPTESGSLTTEGLYRFVRHPIYSGVLAAVIGVTVRSGSLIVLVVGVLTIAFFHIKARWEEDRLAERYPGYPAYAAVTPRFVPRPRRSLGREGSVDGGR